MKKTSKIFTIIAILTLLTLPGCGIVTSTQRPHKNPETWRTFDPNDYGIEVTKGENGSISYRWNLDAGFDEDNNAIPYWKPWGRFTDGPAAKGYLNGNAYQVIFDTGCNPMLVVSEKIVTENDLAVLFFKSENKGSSRALVLVDSLKIGSFELTDYPAGLWRYHPQLKLLGLPLPEHEIILIPLVMMQQFKYFKFDDLQKEISFSKQFSFEPEEDSDWFSLPFRMEGLHLLLDIPIEGIETTLMLDTGADYQLELGESVVQEIFKKRSDFDKAWKRTVHYYGPYADGLVDCKKFTAKNLKFSDRTLNRVKLIYSDRYEDKKYQGVIGAKLFDKTIMVLDFENNLMWVKKAKGSRFEK